MKDKVTFSMPKPLKGGSYRTKDAPRPGWDKTKTEEYKKLHTSDRWRRCRELQLSKFPVCEFRWCDKPADVVHRIRPNDISAFFDADNHLSLCTDHHEGIGRLIRMNMDASQFFKERKIICQE